MRGTTTLASAALAAALALSTGCSPRPEAASGLSPSPSSPPAASQLAPSAAAVPAESTSPAGLRVNPVDGSQLVHVPAGPFTMGSNQGEPDERPVHTVQLPGYWIGRTLVTNRQFARFLNERGNQEEHGLPWLRLGPRRNPGITRAQGWFREVPELADHPVTGVSWYGARAYCAWAGLRLPTEAEFEKAAHGSDARTWPWGDELDLRRLTSRPDGPATSEAPATTSAVTSHLDGASPLGCLDMAGNAWEWCSSLYATYPYRADDGRESPDGDGPRVVRGGGYSHAATFARTTNRYRVHWYYAAGLDRHVAMSTGFRVASSDPSPPSPSSSPKATLERIAHPPMAPHAEPLQVSAADLDRRYRLDSAAKPPATILGYPVDEERERRYCMPLERLTDLADSERARGTQPTRVIEPMSIRPGARIADIGAGSGFFTQLFCRLAGPTGEVWATDISVSSLRYILRRLHEEKDWGSPQRVWLVLHDCTDCLLPPGHFDFVFMSETHYFVYPRARAGASPKREQVLSFYQSIARSLKPSGRFVIYEDSEHHQDQDPERGTLSAAEIAAQMREAGFTQVSHQEIGAGNGHDAGPRLARDLFVFRLAQPALP